MDELPGSSCGEVAELGESIPKLAFGKTAQSLSAIAQIAASKQTLLLNKLRIRIV
jgi:hypothetical protein